MRLSAPHVPAGAAPPPRRRRSPERPRPVDDDGLLGPIVPVGWDQPHPLHDSHTGINPAEDGVLPVQERGRGQRDEELRAVRVWARVRHGYYPRPSVLQVAGDLICELSPERRFTPPPRPCGIPTLHHEVPHDAMEGGAVVVPRGGQRGHVVAGARRVAVVELDDEGADGGVELDVRVGAAVATAAGWIGRGHDSNRSNELDMSGMRIEDRGSRITHTVRATSVLQMMYAYVILLEYALYIHDPCVLIGKLL